MILWGSPFRSRAHVGCRVPVRTSRSPPSRRRSTGAHRIPRVLVVVSVPVNDDVTRDTGRLLEEVFERFACFRVRLRVVSVYQVLCVLGDEVVHPVATEPHLFDEVVVVESVKVVLRGRDIGAADSSRRDAIRRPASTAVSNSSMGSGSPT